jgi:hypothetical protein
MTKLSSSRSDDSFRRTESIREHQLVYHTATHSLLAIINCAEHFDNSIKTARGKNTELAMPTEPLFITQPS